MPLVGKNDRVTKKFADITISEGMKLGDLRKAVAGASSKNRARGGRDTEYSTRARPLLLPPVRADALKLTDLNRIELRQYVPEAEKKKMDRKQKKGVRFHCGAGNRGCEFPMRRVPARDFGALPERRDVGA